MGDLDSVLSKYANKEAGNNAQPSLTNAPSNKDAGFIGTAAQTALREVLPSTAGWAGGTAAVTAAAPALEAATAVNPILGIGASIGVFTLGSLIPSGATKYAQDKIAQAALGDDKFQEMEKDYQANRDKYPMAALVGGLGSQMPLMKLSPKGVGEAFQYIKEAQASGNVAAWFNNKENIVKASHILNTGFGAAMQGGQNALDQINSGKDFNTLDLMANVAAGTLMNKPTEWAESMGNKIGGSMGKLLTRRLTLDANVQEANRRSGLNKAAEDLINRYSEHEYQRGFNEFMQDSKAQAEKAIADRNEQADIERKANIILRGQEASDYLDKQQKLLVNDIAEQKAHGLMVDAQIAGAEQMRKSQLLAIEQMRNGDIDASEASRIATEAATQNIGTHHIDSGIVAATKDASGNEKYYWGQDPERDARKIAIGGVVSNLRSALSKGISEMKSRGGSWWTNESLNNTAQLLDSKIREYNNIRSQTWNERIADQRIPVNEAREAHDARMALARANYEAGVKNTRSDINAIYDALSDGATQEAAQRVGALQSQKSAHQEASAVLARPGELERRAFQLATSGKVDTVAWKEEHRARIEQLKKDFKAKSESVEQFKDVIQVNPEATKAVDNSVLALQERAAQLDANGNGKAASIIREKLNELKNTDDINEKVRILNILDPKHKDVQELNIAKENNRLLGTKQDLVQQEMPVRDASLEGSVKREMEGSKPLEAGYKLSRLAPLEYLSPEAKHRFNQIEGEQKASGDYVMQRLAKSHNDLAKAEKELGLKSGELKTRAEQYINTLRALEVNKIKGEDGFMGKNADLQAKLHEIESQAGFGAVEQYQKQYAALVKETLSKMYDAGMLSKEDYDYYLANTPNYRPMPTDRSEFEQYASKKGFGSKEFSGNAPLHEITAGQKAILDPVESLIGLRSFVDSVSLKQREFKALKEFARTNPRLSSQIEFGYKPTGHEPANSIIAIPDGKGGKEYAHIKNSLLAKALNKLDVPAKNDLLTSIGRLNQIIADMAVHKNPLFAITQTIYDFYASIQNLGSSEIGGKNPIENLKTWFEVTKNWMGSYGKAISSGLRGIESVKGKDAALYNEFWHGGGAWAGQHNTPAEAAKKIYKEAAIKAGDAATAGLFQAWHDITHINETLPNALRYGMYKTARERGLSHEKAIKAAMDIMPNYLDKPGSALLNNLGQYKVFLNASIRGSERFVRSTFFDKDGKYNPAGFISLVAGSLALQQAVRTANDFKDEHWREKWNSERNMVFVIDKNRAISIPMEWAQRPVHQLIGMMVDSMNGKKGDWTVEDLHALLGGALEAYSPVGGGTSLADILSPSFAQPIVDIEKNKGYSGKPIVGAGLTHRVEQGLPAHLAFYDDMHKTLLGTAAIEGAKVLSDANVEIEPQKLAYLMRQWFSAPAAFAEGNIGSRFYREMTPEQVERIETDAIRAKINPEEKQQKSELATKRFEESKKIDALAKQLKELSINEQKRQILALAAGTPEDYQLAVELNQRLRKQAADQYMKLSKKKTTE